MTVPQLRDHAAISKAIVDQQITLAPELTDYVEGSVIRSLDDAIAIVQQGVEYAAFDAARQAILVGTYANFQFSKLPAVASSGIVRFQRTSALTSETIAAGFQVRVPGSATRVYEVLTGVTLGVGITSMDAPVRCLTVGVIGNTAANTIVELVTSGFSGTVTNLLPFLSGQAEESDDARLQRFQLFVGNLSRGTAAAIESAARAVVRTDANGNVIERAVAVKVKEPFLEDLFGRIGLVHVYLDNGSGTVSSELKALVEQTLRGYTDVSGRHPGWVSAGIDLQVFGVTATAVEVACVVTIDPRWNAATVRQEAQDAIVAYLNGLPVFASAVFAELVAAVMAVDGVTDVVFSAPTANVVTAGRIVAGTVVVA